MTTRELAVRWPEKGPEWALSDRNRQWAHALEGRTVWSHCLWVGQPVKEPGVARCCGAHELKAATVVRDPVGDLALYHDGLSGERLRFVEHALGLLAETRHLTMPVLAGGAVLASAEASAHEHTVVEVADQSDVDGLAVDVLTYSARTVLTKWYAAMDAFCGRQGVAPQSQRDYETVATLFTRCLAFEHYQRRIEQGAAGERHELVRRREALGQWLFEASPDQVFTGGVAESIVAELVSYYYPFWNRSHFPFHSPWDNFRVRTNIGGVE